MAFVCDIPAKPTLLQDDDAVRVTRWDFSPGAVTGWHEHGWPYTVVMVTDGEMKVHNGAEIAEARFKAGDSYARPAGVKHDVMNASTQPMAFIEVEYKKR
ncbi:cupin domain-containing protein [Terrarubrum flagellatum]|uniref:cupin domain-containing protein n=1 Tax=Terrirubrum flagellatum TaxID=2895980 RepID=UPI00314519B8